jgi:hypothetical protein
MLHEKKIPVQLLQLTMLQQIKQLLIDFIYLPLDPLAAGVEVCLSPKTFTREVTCFTKIIHCH